jgi:hypothetical protein
VFERLAVEADGGFGRVRGAGLPARAAVPLGGACGVARRLVVLGDDGRVLLDARARLRDEPRGRLLVQATALALEQPFVGHASEQRVLEDVLARAREGRSLAPVDKLFAPERLKRGGRVALHARAALARGA